MEADFFTPENFAALSIISAPDWGHLKERFALGSLESLGLPAHSSTSQPFQMPFPIPGSWLHHPQYTEQVGIRAVRTFGKWKIHSMCGAINDVLLR